MLIKIHFYNFDSWDNILNNDSIPSVCTFIIHMSVSHLYIYPPRIFLQLTFIRLFIYYQLLFDLNLFFFLIDLNLIVVLMSETWNWFQNRGSVNQKYCISGILYKIIASISKPIPKAQPILSSMPVLTKHPTA